MAKSPYPVTNRVVKTHNGSVMNKYDDAGRMKQSGRAERNQRPGVTKMADGGKVKPKPKPKPETKPKPEQLGSGMARRAGETLRNRRAEQMRELGLKDGGKATRALPARKPLPKPKKGPKPERITTSAPPGGRRPKSPKRGY